MNIGKLNHAVAIFREDLGPGMVSCDIWGQEGLSLAGYAQQPAAVALFSDMTTRLRKVLGDAGFPNVGRYYLIELENRHLVCVMMYRDFQWGSLIDLSKTNLGLLLAVALPKAMENLKAGVESM